MAISDKFDFLIQWHLTEKCNLRCRHCYQEGQCRAELSTTSCIDVIDEVAEMLDEWESAYGMSFSPSFNITGGEPLLRNDLFEILEMLCKHNFPVFLLTNGTTVSPEVAQKLTSGGIRGAQVSLEGPEEVHEYIRGKGTFSAACSGVRELVAAGIKVTINTTISRLNAAHMEEMISIVTRLGAHRLGFSRFVPSGRGIGLIDKLLERDEIKELYNRLLTLEISGVEIVTGDPVAAQMGCNAPIEANNTAIGGCAAGISGLTLLSDGTVVPCRRLELPLGNVLNDSLREIWATSPVLESLRKRKCYGEPCGSCKRWSNCRGCRAIAHAYSATSGKADFLAGDPHCFIT